MTVVAKVVQLLYKAAFSKGSFAIFAGMKVSGASLSLFSATTVDAAISGVLPWLGWLAVDIGWYAMPWLLKQTLKLRLLAA